VDVGSGHCSITQTPDNKFFIYDAGHWTGQLCFKAAKRIIGNNPIEVMILSHSDSDHIGDAYRILNHFKVKSLYRTGTPRKTKTWKKMVSAIELAKKNGLREYNHQDIQIKPGSYINLGDSVLTFIYGKANWSGLSTSENRNAVSIVTKYEVNGHSILFTGDTIGRRLNDKPSACKDAEKEMVNLHENGVVSLKSSVVIAPHHGGNNASSICFIQKVNPTYVIFPSGHKHGHPDIDAFNRYIDNGVQASNVFRTDLNDRESKDEDDWEDLNIPGCYDKASDDDIEIIISDSVSVNYRDDGVESLCKT